MLRLSKLFGRAAHAAAAEEIDQRGLNTSSDGYRSTDTEAASRFTPRSPGMTLRRPIP